MLRIDLLKCPCGAAYHRVMGPHTAFYVAWAYGYHKQIWLCEGCGADLEKVPITDCLNSLVVVESDYHPIREGWTEDLMFTGSWPEDYISKED